MRTSKTKMSISISSHLARLLEDDAKNSDTSKSALIEEALHQWVENKLIEDAKATAKATFDDLPTEDEWLQIQSKW